ncbi:MAG: YebF family protein [Sodalis sp. (in: enterobacteria)]|uniref:YebF family protein n=1 Tax=Sodalis sp. (in: enterobacteria) TaxID=1898979 RepID=UPI003F36EF9E
MNKTGNRVAGLLMSSMSARADDATPVPAQENAGQSTTQASGKTTPAPAGNANAAGGRSASAQGNANATGTTATLNGQCRRVQDGPPALGNANATGMAKAPNGNADAAGAAPAQGNARGAAPEGNPRANTGAGRQVENNAAAKNGANGAAKGGGKAAAKKTPADKAAADKAAKAKNAKSGASATTPGIAKVSHCPDLNATQVAEFVVQDYTQNRFQRSEQDQQAAGGRRPAATISTFGLIRKR